MNPQERKPLDECSDLGLRRLDCAIIESAACDYRNGGRSVKRNEAKAKMAIEKGDAEKAEDLLKEAEKSKREMELCKKFFFSERFKILAPDLDPQAVIEALDKQIAEYDPFPPKKKRKKEYKKRIVLNR